jgi:hypothetical protein
MSFEVPEPKLTPPKAPRKRIYCEPIFKKYDVLIGGGGSGDVYASTKDPKIAAKLIVNRLNCMSALLEFGKHKRVYKAFKKYGNPETSIVPKPYRYCDFKQPKGKYACMYEMERLYSPRKDEHTVIFTFNLLTEGLVNKVVTRFDRPIDIDNPPIGYFMSLGKLISKYSKDRVEKIIRTMGELHAIVCIGSRLDGADIEFVLTKNGKIGLIDFGMCYNLTGEAENDARMLISLREIDQSMPSRIIYPTYALLELKAFCETAFMIAKMERDPVRKKTFAHYYVNFIEVLQNKTVLSFLSRAWKSNYRKNQEFFTENVEALKIFFFEFEKIHQSVADKPILKDLSNHKLDIWKCNIQHFIKIDFVEIEKAYQELKNKMYEVFSKKENKAGSPQNLFNKMMSDFSI